MGISPLVPIAGAALGSLATKAWDRLTNAPSFLEVLQADSRQSPSEEEDADNLDRASGLRGADALGPRDLEPMDGTRQERLQAELDRFDRLLRQRLGAAGIRISMPVELKSDGGDGVIVDSSHPDRAAIEELLARDTQLSAAFNQLASAFTEENLARYSAPDGLQGEFRLRLEANGTQVVFE